MDVEITDKILQSFFFLFFPFYQYCSNSHVYVCTSYTLVLITVINEPNQNMKSPSQGEDNPQSKIHQKEYVEHGRA